MRFIEFMRFTCLPAMIVWFNKRIADNNIFWAIFPNVAVGAAFLHFAQVQDQDRLAGERQFDTASKILTAASDVMLELYPPNISLKPDSAATGAVLLASEKRFEGLYWGQLGLISTEPVERCLTELHETLLAAVNGERSSTDPSLARRQIEFKLAAIADGLRDMYHDQSHSTGAGSAGAILPPGAGCRR